MSLPSNAVPFASWLRLALAALVVCLSMSAATARTTANWCSAFLSDAGNLENFDPLDIPVSVTTKSNLFSDPEGLGTLNPTRIQSLFLRDPEPSAANLVNLHNGNGTSFWADPKTVMCAPKPLKSPNSDQNLRVFVGTDLWAVYAVVADELLIGPEQPSSASIAPKLTWRAQEAGFLWLSSDGFISDGGLNCRQSRQGDDCDETKLFGRHLPILNYAADGAILLANIGPNLAAPYNKMFIPKADLRLVQIETLVNLTEVQNILQHLSEKEQTKPQTAAPKSSLLSGCVAHWFTHRKNVLRTMLTDILDNQASVPVSKDKSEPIDWCLFTGKIFSPKNTVPSRWSGRSERVIQGSEVARYVWMPKDWTKILTEAEWADILGE